MKYAQMHPAAHRLGRMLALAIGTLAGDAPAEMLVVPVPLHRSKHAQRGFNQARLLATHALDALRKSHPEWRLKLAASTLMRIRATESQTSLTPRQRRRNVSGAFLVSDQRAVAQQHILVIDDIFTTGATARATAKALMNAGAASVWVATLARARRTSDNRTRAMHSNSFTETSNNPGLRRPASADNPQPASMHSYGNQPSF